MLFQTLIFSLVPQKFLFFIIIIILAFALLMVRSMTEQIQLFCFNFWIVLPPVCLFINEKHTHTQESAVDVCSGLCGFWFDINTAVAPNSSRNLY